MSRRGVARDLVTIVAAAGPLLAQTPSGAPPPAAPLLHPDETHLKNLRQLTFGGENARDPPAGPASPSTTSVTRRRPRRRSRS